MSAPAPFFVAGDRALCVHPHPGLQRGTLYYVHSVTSTAPQHLFLTSLGTTHADGWEASRFLQVRPRTGQTKMPLD